jgi:hypothetical protein
MFKQPKLALVLTVLILISLFAGFSGVLADAPSPSEPDPAAANDNIQASEFDPEVLELQAAPQQPDGPVDSEGNPTDAQPALAQQEPVEETLVPEEPQATITYFKNYSGVAFQPRDSDTGYDYFGSGCISSKGADYFVLNLQLPTGAVIDFFRMYYYDSSTANARMYLTWYNGQGGYSDLAYIDSSGSAGYGSVGGATNYTVDPVKQSINLIWRPNTTGSSMALCGVRIRYQVEVGQAFLPSLQYNNMGQ